MDRLEQELGPKKRKRDAIVEDSTLGGPIMHHVRRMEKRHCVAPAVGSFFLDDEIPSDPNSDSYHAEFPTDEFDPLPPAELALPECCSRPESSSGNS